MKKNVLICALCVGACTIAAAQPERNQEKDTTSTVHLLKEIVVTSSQIDDRAPVTLQTIRSKEISDYLSTKTFPEILRNIGGVYATPESGSYGDAKINIRGFKQENYTVMLNGVPLSGFRSGSMFWNNWLGLTDATYRVQLQKGVGGSMLASNSMGGTINILTQTANPVAARSVALHSTDYGLNSLRLSIQTGETENGWAVGFTGSRTWGEAWIDAAPVDSWGYFLNIRKRIDRRRSLLFTLLGSPESHGQRSQKLSQAEVDRFGPKYNKNWGLYRGQINNISANTYHKPYLAASYFFTLSDKMLLAHTLYLSVGNGGGKWTENAGGTKIINHQTPDGQIDWEAVTAANRASGQSLNIQSDYRAGHTWAGFKSSFHYTPADSWEITSGVHYQYFYSWQNEQITDLLGGEYWLEDYENNSLAGLAGRNPRKSVGDNIRLHNGDRDHHLSLYTQANYTANRLHAFAGILLTTTLYRHWDRYNYPQNPLSDPVTAWGGNLKAGLAYRLTNRQQLYLNGGYYSRAPYSNAYFASNTNEITKNVRNEHNYIAEGGYKYATKHSRLTLTAYYNYWKNKTLTSDPYKQEDRRPYQISGLDARHLGLELEYEQNLAPSASIRAFASIGHWQWKNDVDATLYDPYTGRPSETIRIFTDGLLVGDAPQTQVGLTADVKLFRRLTLRSENRYNARMYANFDPARRTNPDDRQQSYRIPAFFIADLHLQLPVSIFGLAADCFLSCNNLLNHCHIERGDDGANHDLATFRGFWSAGRTLQAGFRLSF